MKQTQSLKGFRDFLPCEKRQRDYVLQKIIEVFERFGFEPIETPTLEYAELLKGKYGKEADKLIYTFKDRGGREIGLKYDQTVPTARVLAQYKDKLPKYFRRYQIQNVFRAEKAQKGRYREFTQCDIDIFGSVSPLADAEILACTYFAFKNVGYPNVILKINDRKTLFSAFGKFTTDSVSVFSIIQSVDKLDKISEVEVIRELTKKDLSEEIAKQALSEIQSVSISENLSVIKNLAIDLGVPSETLQFSPALARGLDYYTGMIFETNVPGYGSGSLGGGGRYDELIEQLGGVSIPAVGIAFGFDRMVEAARDLNLINLINLGTQVLVTVFNESLLKQSIDLTNRLREAGICAEIFVEPGEKLDRQLKYADYKKIPYVIIIGPDEVSQRKLLLKNMLLKTQTLLTLEELIQSLLLNK